MSGHALLVFQTVLLVAISLSVLYPVVAYSRSVLHTEAIVALAVSTLVFTAGSLLEQALGERAAAEGVYLLSAVLFVVSVWLFAREFVRAGEASFGTGEGPAPSSGSGVPDVPDQAGDGFAEATESGSAEGGFAEAPESGSVSGGFASTTEGDDGE